MKTLKYALRFLSRSKSYTIINLLGLSFSLACCIILIRYVHSELTVDSHSVDPERIVVSLRDLNGNVYPGTYYKESGDNDSDFMPEAYITEKCRINTFQHDNVGFENTNYSVNTLAADSTFFNFFAYKAMIGKAMLASPTEAVISKAFAKRVFGKENPVGKILNYQGKDLTIAGVLEAPESKTLLQFDLLISFQFMKDWRRMPITLIRILPSVNLEEINKVSNLYVKERGYMIRWKFDNWKDFYFEKALKHNDQYNSVMHFGNRTHLFILSAAAVLLLLIGILNFINIYMVFMMKRSKEYGIKKVFGLQGLPMFMQIWVENQILAFAALMIAWLIVEITQLPVSYLFNEQIKYSTFDWQISLCFLLILPLATSVYPYIKYNHRLSVISIRSITTSKDSVVVRMTFLFAQYVITVLLLIMSIYFIKHLNMMLNTPPGFKTEGIMKAQLLYENKHYLNPTKESSNTRISRQLRIKQLLNECPDIENWMNSSSTIFNGDGIGRIFNDKDESESLTTMYVSPDFLKLYDLKVVEGKIPEKFDGWSDFRIMLSKTAMKALGYKTVKDAFIRSESPLWVVQNEKGEKVEGATAKTPVDAVIDDYYFGHLTEGIKPIIFIVAERSFGNDYLISVKPGKEKALVKHLQKIVKEIYNTEEFSYSWLSDEREELYSEDKETAHIYTVFAIIAILVCCLGLFGLSLFDIRQRYREIAIRKVNGAGIMDIYRLLFRKYVVILIASFAVAAPLAYLFINLYTRGFVVKAPIGIGIFIISFVVVSSISLGTLFWQIKKAANINPAKVIKSE